MIFSRLKGPLLVSLFLSAFAQANQDSNWIQVLEGSKLFSPEFVKWSPDQTQLEIFSFNRRYPPSLHLNLPIVLGSGVKCKWDGIERDCRKDFYLNPKGLQPQRHRFVVEGAQIHKSLDVQFLPKNMPTLKIKGRSSTSEPFVFSLERLDVGSKVLEAKSCHLFILSPEGKLNFYRRLAEQCTDFRPHLVSGKTYYSYAVIRESFGQVADVGTRIILNENFDEVKRIEDLDVSDFELLGLEDWIGMNLSLEKSPAGHLFLNQSLKEIRDSKVVFQWSLLDYIRQFNTEMFPGSEILFYKGQRALKLLRLNSFQRIGTKGYLLNLADSGIGYFDLQSGKVDWMLGGFQDQFHVHDALISHAQNTVFFDPEKSELLLFSNRNTGDYQFPESRVLKYRIDIPQRLISGFTELSLKKFVSATMGSVQESKNGSFTIGFGSRDLGGIDMIEYLKEETKMSFSILSPEWRTRRIYRQSLPSKVE